MTVFNRDEPQTGSTGPKSDILPTKPTDAYIIYLRQVSSYTLIRVNVTEGYQIN